MEENNQELTPQEEVAINLNKRLEVKGHQHSLFGSPIPLTEFKNLKEKQEVKERVKAMFNGEMIRSIITPKDTDNNIRSNKLVRLSENEGYKAKSEIEQTIQRADSFGKKTLSTLSTFPSLIVHSYVNLLTKEGDKVYDPFMGHNSRAEDVLSCGRKYYGYDIHTFPVEFTKKACERFPPEDYELNLGSSETCKYADNSFDFALTCPPYAYVEEYNKIYGEEKEGDLSSKEYDEFLWIYNKCLKETYRVLKPGAYFVIVVGDIHKNGQYTSIMLDTIKICKMAGFNLHDINIYNRKSNIGGDLNYKTFILTCKRFPTIHEFILVFRKEASCKEDNKK